VTAISTVTAFAPIAACPQHSGPCPTSATLTTGTAFLTRASIAAVPASSRSDHVVVNRHLALLAHRDRYRSLASLTESAP
jgi:hypothetical protein